MVTVITIRKVPKTELDAYVDLAEPFGKDPHGLTLLPSKRKSYNKIEIMIREKMSKADTRNAMAHELYHAYQFAVDCEFDEENSYKIADDMVLALKEKRKKKKK
jgi:hypothetical protein